MRNAIKVRQKVLKGAFFEILSPKTQKVLKSSFEMRNSEIVRNKKVLKSALLKS